MSTLEGPRPSRGKADDPFDGIQPPPLALEMEQASLGSMLISTSACDRLLDVLTEEDFYFECHQIVFAAIKQLREEDQPVDASTVEEVVEAAGLLSKIGGRNTLTASLIESVATAAHAEYYAGQVVEKWKRRKLAEARDTLHELVYQDDVPVAAICDKTVELIESIRLRGQENGAKPFGELVQPFLTRLDAISSGQHVGGVATGYAALDALTGGLQPADLIILASRPSVGKSALACCISDHIAAAGGIVPFFSLEMSEQQIVERLICARARVDSVRLRTGFLRAGETEQDNDYWRLMSACGKLGDTRLWIDDTSDASVTHVRSVCRSIAAAEKEKLSLVVIDYIGLVRSEGRLDSRVREVGVICARLKQLAKELECPVLAISQLNRKVEDRKGNRPALSDLRESGEVEAHADLVWLLYRRAYYEQDEQEREAWDNNHGTLDETEVIFAKHRNGPTGVATLGFNRRYGVFDDLPMEGR